MKTFTRGLALLVLSLPAWSQGPAKQVEIFGQKIQYLEAGSGPNVILLHGLGADSSSWMQNIAVLATKYHVYVPDQIGFGASDKPLMNYRVATLVDFLEGFAKTLGIDKAVVVGNSLGGWTAAAFALAHPERVDKLVLVDAAGYSFNDAPIKPTREMMEGMNPSTIAGTKALLAVIFANKMFQTDAMAQMMFARHLHNNDGYTIERFIDSILRGEDFMDGKLGAIKAPTLVAWGREDALVPLASGERYAKDIAGAQLVVFDHCGHVPQLECASQFNASLMKFLGGETTSSR